MTPLRTARPAAKPLMDLRVRKVDNPVKALGADTGTSKSDASRICTDRDVEVGLFADRDNRRAQMSECERFGDRQVHRSNKISTYWLVTPTGW